MKWDIKHLKYLEQGIGNEFFALLICFFAKLLSFQSSLLQTKCIVLVSLAVATKKTYT